MSSLSNESFSHFRCVEATLSFSAVAQRLIIKLQRRTRDTFMSSLSNEVSLISGVSKRLYPLVLSRSDLLYEVIK